MNEMAHENRRKQRAALALPAGWDHRWEVVKVLRLPGGVKEWSGARSSRGEIQGVRAKVKPHKIQILRDDDGQHASMNWFSRLLTQSVASCLERPELLCSPMAVLLSAPPDIDRGVYSASTTRTPLLGLGLDAAFLLDNVKLPFSNYMRLQG